MTHPRTPRLLHAALAAADRGWPVFPLFPGSKRPAITGWQHHATRDPDVLTAWWNTRPYNIGIACGPARLLVVDIDRPHQTDLRDGDLLGVETYVVVTPHGFHLYFTVDPGQPGRSTVGRLDTGIDTRAIGGYVVAAGSVRRLNGSQQVYRRISPPDRRPRPAPSTLLTRLEPRVLHPMTAPERDVRSVGPYGHAALAGELTRVGHAPFGTRNTAVFTAALKLGRLVSRGLLDHHDVAEHLTRAAAAHVGVNGFTAAEADTAIANGLRRGAALDT